MVAKTLFGLEEILADELRKLGAGGVQTGRRSVSFIGDLGFMYKANLCLRTAIKVLKPIASFPVFSEADLYNKVKKISWEQYMTADGRLAVDATVHSQQFTHSKYIALKTKDAVVDRFRENLPEVALVETPSTTVRIVVLVRKSNI